MDKTRVLVAMSGGVDSSVAAARLFDAGHEVVGCTLHLWDYPEAGPGSHSRCCAPEDQYDARRVADKLGFPHFTFDRRALFAKNVVEPFVDAYLSGETPSPCTTCNRTVKLAELFDIADKLGASHVATGHYARVVDGHLFAGRDPSKDQSYFLYATPPAMLARMVFPLGDSAKEDVRAEAVSRKLPGAGKGESQELCFIGEGAGAYTRFVEQRAKPRLRPGPIVDDHGKVVGAHDGIHRFTVGQRKGLGVSTGPEPAFVTRIDAEASTIHIGPKARLAATSATLRDLVLAPGVTLPREAIARVRYRHVGVRAIAEGDSLRFIDGADAVSPGQVAVLYDGERVLGGGVIAQVTQ